MKGNIMNKEKEYKVIKPFTFDMLRGYLDEDSATLIAGRFIRQCVPFSSVFRGKDFPLHQELFEPHLPVIEEAGFVKEKKEDPIIRIGDVLISDSDNLCRFCCIDRGKYMLIHVGRGGGNRYSDTVFSGPEKLSVINTCITSPQELHLHLRSKDVCCL